MKDDFPFAKVVDRFPRFEVSKKVITLLKYEKNPG
jgi:hypothetical protein